MVQLDYRDARPIYVQIVDGIRRQIVTGVLENGDKLPSIRELAQEISINPNTIQRAYRELEYGGWIVTIPAKGCFVCGVPSEVKREQLLLMETLEKTIDALLGLGVPREVLMEKVEKGGSKHA